MAVLYYTSCWDFVGIKIEIVGMDPNCYHPKPRPTTPHDFLDSALFMYQKETQQTYNSNIIPTKSQQLYIFIQFSISFVEVGILVGWMIGYKNGKVKVH